MNKEKLKQLLKELIEINSLDEMHEQHLKGILKEAFKDETN